MERKYIAVLPGGTTAHIELKTDEIGVFTLNIATDDDDPVIELEVLFNNGEFLPGLNADYIIVVRGFKGDA